MRSDLKSKPDVAELAEAAEDRRLNLLTETVIGAAIEVHRHLGPGLLDSAYEQCLCFELSQAATSFQRQVSLPVSYKGLHLECAYSLDLLVENEAIVEIKAVDEILPVHKAQLLTYLQAAHKRVGLLINFNVPIPKNGLTHMVDQYAGAATPPRTWACDLRVSAVIDHPAANTEPA
jgi:GxxExxY protein